MDLSYQTGHPPQPTILFEDNHLLVLMKPAGMPSQQDQTGDFNVYDWAYKYIKTTYNRPGNVFIGLLHRLDRPVGGVMVIAKTSKAAERLSHQFKTRTIAKTYWAIVEGFPPADSDQLTHYLRKRRNVNVVDAYLRPETDAQLAILDYKVLARFQRRSWLALHPITGRQHQIRAQLAQIGCPIVGDVKYGARSALPDRSIALFAHRIEFEHPTLKTPHSWEAWPPDATPWNLIYSGQV
jgi:23S rRNA pseudouridine1911/1915/1917 synthase